MIHYRVRSLVSDLDGVVFQHPKLMRHVSDRVVQFVKKKIHPYMSDKKAKKINESLYKQYGHTLLGLQAVYNPDISLQSFCNYVYAKEFVQSMDQVPKDNLYYEHQTTLKHILTQYDSIQKPFYIFSNSPMDWCQNAIQMMDLPISPDRIFGCNHELYLNQCRLKPMKECYHHIQHTIEQREGHPYKTQIIYIDDQLSNLTPILENPYWKPIWYAPEDSIHSSKLTTMKDMEELRLFI